MCQNLFVLEWTIVASPDPDNPNQQPVGNTVLDHRLYGCRVVSVTTQGQCYNKEQFSKPVNSSTLTALGVLAFAQGWVLTALVQKCCFEPGCIPS